MDILIFLGCFLLGILLSLWPKPFKKLSTFFDTLIHEAGHGIASLPFGAPLPDITVRKNTSGETLSSMGYLHQMLPLGLGRLTEKIARLMSLMAGYSAGFLFASLLLVLAITPTTEFQPWQLLLIAQIALATLLWTAVRVTDSPWTFLVVFGVVTALYLMLFPWDWKIWLIAMAVIVVLFFLLRSWLSIFAVMLTLGSALTIIVGIFLSSSMESNNFLETLNITVDNLTLTKILMITLLVFLAFSCRSWLSLCLTVLILGFIIALLFIPFVNYSYILTAVAALLYSASTRSYIELYGLTFRKTSKHWSASKPDTDMVFASEELGAKPEFWYWVVLIVGIVGSLAILFFGYFLS